MGVVSSDTLAGRIRHSGWLLSVLVGVGRDAGDRAELFSLDLTDLKLDLGKNSIAPSGITLKLTPGPPRP
jgi:hypothetical protein